MANVIPNAFRGELFSGTHNFASGGDAFKIALYTGSIASVYTTASTTVSSTNEVSTGGGSNYSRQALSSQAVASSTAVATVDFGDSTWSSATFTAAYASPLYQLVLMEHLKLLTLIRQHQLMLL
jgi:hypothetical protein